MNAPPSPENEKGPPYPFNPDIICTTCSASVVWTEILEAEIEMGERVTQEKLLWKMFEIWGKNVKCNFFFSTPPALSVCLCQASAQKCSIPTKCSWINHISQYCGFCDRHCCENQTLNRMKTKPNPDVIPRRVQGFAQTTSKKQLRELKYRQRKNIYKRIYVRGEMFSRCHTGVSWNTTWLVCW